MTQVNIGAFLDRTHVVPGLIARNKTELIRELAQRAAIAVKLDANPIISAISSREQLGSTGVGHGVAIPHARIDGLSKPFGMFARVEPPVDFAAIDNAPVDLVFLLLTATQQSSEHLTALACVSRRLRDPAVAKTLRAASTAKEMFAALTE